MPSRACALVTVLGCALYLAAAQGCGHGAQQTAAGATTHAPGAPLRRFVSPHSYEHFLRAELALARGAYTDAVEHYREALSDEDDPFVLARLAEALDLAGSHEAANDALAHALTVDPESEAAWLARGSIAERRHDASSALEAYAKAAEAAPSSAEPVLALHRLLAAMGQDERARAALVRYRTSNADGVATDATARVALELALTSDNASALVGAVDDWLRVGALDAATAHRATCSLVAQHRTAAALRLVEALPDSSRDPACAIEAFLAAARFDAALALLAQLPPDALGEPTAVAEAYLAAGKPDAALRVLELADPADPADGTLARVVRADAELALADYVRAAVRFATVPVASAHRGRAIAGLATALRAQGLAALAAELEANAAPR